MRQTEALLAALAAEPQQAIVLAADAAELPTFPSELPVRKIDWVLLSPALAECRCTVTVLREPLASDHAPLLAVIEAPPSPSLAAQRGR